MRTVWPGGLGAPAEVDVVAHEGQPAVEAAELLPHVAADQHAGGGDGQHLADLVVLALVLLAAFQAGPAAAAAGDADADLEQLRGGRTSCGAWGR